MDGYTFVIHYNITEDECCHLCRENERCHTYQYAKPPECRETCALKTAYYIKELVEDSPGACHVLAAGMPYFRNRRPPKNKSPQEIEATAFTNASIHVKHGVTKKLYQKAVFILNFIEVSLYHD